MTSNTLKCVCCDKDKLALVMVHSEHGPMCGMCHLEMHYEGWDRRAAPLTLEQTKQTRQSNASK